MSFSVTGVKGLHSNEKVEAVDGAVDLAAASGIVSFAVAYDEKPSKMTFRIQPWAQRLEGLRVEGESTEEVRHGPGVHVDIAGDQLTLTLTDEALAKVTSGATLQLVDFFR